MAPQSSQWDGSVRPRRGDRPSGARLDRLLRGLLPLRAVLPRKAYRRASRSMGHAEIQTTTRESVKARAVDVVRQHQPRLFADGTFSRLPRCAVGAVRRATGHVRFCEAGGCDPPGDDKHPTGACLADTDPRFQFDFTPTSSSWLNSSHVVPRTDGKASPARGLSFCARPDRLNRGVPRHRQGRPLPYVWAVTAESHPREGRTRLDSPSKKSANSETHDERVIGASET